MRQMAVQDPKPDLVFPKINCGHEGQDKVMQLHADGGGNLVPASQPGHPDGEQRLQTPERGEPEENPNRSSQSDRVRAVLDRDQAKMQVPKPVTETLPEIRFRLAHYLPNEK